MSLIFPVPIHITMDDTSAPSQSSAAAAESSGARNGRHTTGQSQMSSSLGDLGTGTTGDFSLDDDDDDDFDKTQVSQSPQGINWRVVALRRAMVNERVRVFKQILNGELST